MGDSKTQIPFQSALCLAHCRHPCVCLAKERGWQNTVDRDKLLRCHSESRSKSGKMKDFQTGHQDVVEANSKWRLAKLTLSVFLHL